MPNDWAHLQSSRSFLGLSFKALADSRESFFARSPCNADRMAIAIPDCGLLVSKLPRWRLRVGLI